MMAEGWAGRDLGCKFCQQLQVAKPIERAFRLLAFRIAPYSVFPLTAHSLDEKLPFVGNELGLAHSGRQPIRQAQASNRSTRICLFIPASIAVLSRSFWPTHSLCSRVRWTSSGSPPSSKSKG